MDSNSLQDSNLLQDFSLKDEIKKYLLHWKWFLLSMSLFLLLGIFYLKKTSSKYKANSTILIKDSGEGRGLSELSAFEDLTGLSGGSNDIDDEVDIIKSKSLIEKVVKKLGLNIYQNSKMGLRNVDLYRASPIEVRFKPIKDLSYSSEDFGPFRVVINSNNFTFYDIGLESENEFNYGQIIKHKYGEFVIEKSTSFKDNFEADEIINDITISILSIESVALSFHNSLIASAKNKKSSLVDISLKGSNTTKLLDFLDTLVKIYNEEAILDQNLVSKNTIKFIDERLSVLTSELRDVENIKTNFKEDKSIADIKVQSEQFVLQVSESQNKLLGIETQLNLTNYIFNYLNKESSNEFELLPANIGVSDESLNNTAQLYNRKVLERRGLLVNSTELNPLVVDLTRDLRIQKGNLLESLRNEIKSLQIKKKEFGKQNSKINSRIKDIPKIEQGFRSIARQQKIKENLYLFLLKRKEDLSISMAVTAPPAKVIDKAYCSFVPVSPNKKIVIFSSLMLGFLVPFSLFYLLYLLDTKVNDRKDVENVLKNTPLLVEVARVKKGTSDVLKINDRSVLGESFRILRTNLNYLGKSKKKEGKALRVFITSTVKGEGKTFVSFNTVLALADSSKKILVIGADVRNPQLHRYLKNDKNARGLSDYLYDNTLEFEEIVNTVNFNNHNIDYVTSGRIPPNPSELLMNGRLEELLDYLDDNHDYDYIIVDTAPTMLVTDTLIICESADVTIYVVRADYTDKNLLTYASQLKQEGKINNMAIVLNDVKEGRIGYGYSYGYGETKKKWYQTIFSKS